MLLIQLIGHLGKDAESRTVSDRPVISFSVGVKTGKDSTQWVNVTANEGLAKGVLPYLKKGTAVFITGDGKAREYDRKEGGKGFSVEVWASKIQLVGGKSESNSGGSDVGQTQAPSIPRAPVPAPRNDFEDGSSVPF